MKFIIIDDEIYKVTACHFNEIEKTKKSGDENALIELFEKRRPEYLFLCYVSFSFRG